MPAVELTPDQIKSVLAGISIPPQPQIMVDLQMEQMSPDCSIVRIAELISHDVGLSGSILKTVNSSFFRHSNTITSVKQAVSLLGIKSVINIVNALSIRGELSDEAIVAMGRFWDSANDVAMAAALIAKHIGYHSPDEAYTLGLFHNAGIPLLMRRFANYLDVTQQGYASTGPTRRVIDIENEKYNTNHAVLGYYVAKSWKLPDYLCSAIAEHHNALELLEEAEPSDHNKRTLLAILKMAEHICGLYRCLGNQKEDAEWAQLSDSLLLFTGLSDYDFQSLVESCQEMGLGGSDYIAL